MRYIGVIKPFTNHLLTSWDIQVGSKEKHLYLDLPDMPNVCLLVFFFYVKRQKFYTQKEDPGIQTTICCFCSMMLVNVRGVGF